jgi:transcription-repair coupling factor (superfamily II helicase)
MILKSGTCTSFTRDWQQAHLPQPIGSADALPLAWQRRKAAGGHHIVTSDAATAQRLMDEMAFCA